MIRNVVELEGICSVFDTSGAFTVLGLSTKGKTRAFRQPAENYAKLAVGHRIEILSLRFTNISFLLLCLVQLRVVPYSLKLLFL